MLRQPVTSSDIRAIGYDKHSLTLEIEFNRGGLYEYANVPEAVYRGLMSASSHGKYFHQYIRDKYETRKLA